MSAYSFLPWLRRGIATRITADPGTSARAGVSVTLRLTGTPVSGGAPLTRDVTQTVQLYGPGDVVGVDPRAVVRIEPRHQITDFEPDYLAHIEFYDEDFPWRYSPAPPDATTKRLRPWLALIVLREDEFTDGSAPDRPLPFVTLTDLALLPPADQLGAWAHVHVNRSVTGGDTEAPDVAAALTRLQAVLTENPDLASSRIVCPRRLESDTVYHAFLVPAFETGRLAGLGLDPARSPGALHGSWVPYQNRPESLRLCHYHRWRFRTGGAGDFESLVRLLKPRTLGARVGNRDIDVLRPGANLPAIDDHELGGVLRLGGALKVPDTALSPEELAEAQKYENWDQPYPHPFQRALAALINLADDYATETALTANQGFHALVAAEPGADVPPGGDPDPLITPPLYGRWHALTSRLLLDRQGAPVENDDNWVHELNLDPRFRVAAGLGTKVVQARQEEFMAAAWAQLGEVLEANRRIRAAQLSREVAFVLHSAHLRPLAEVAPGRALAVTALAHSRLNDSELTVSSRVAESTVAGAPLSAAMRRTTRPGSRLIRGLPFGEEPPELLLSKMNAGQVQAAPPKTAPPGVVTVERLDRELNPPPPPPPRLQRLVRRFAGPSSTADTPTDPVDLLPKSPDFVVSLPGEGVTPTAGAHDSPEAIRFKNGLREIYRGLREAAEAGAVPARTALNLTELGELTDTGLDPDLTIPRRVAGGIFLPSRFRPSPGLGLLAGGSEPLTEVMAYPVFDVPMYRPLLDLSAEFFLPNINLVPQNSITLVETNQRFIESYLVGLNHEMARELLWREYPTDQRGTPFRQFWDVSTVLPRPGEHPALRRERLRDIPPLDRWEPDSALGDHDHREAGGAPEDELVLVIRGELLKRYPTAVIYAHRAAWRMTGNVIDPTKPRFLAPLTPAEEADPPPTKVLMPLYEAKADPDITFLGFDLTEEEARGGTGQNPADDPGWFFVIKERPGEPRFGLDAASSGPLQVWNDLAWPDVLPAGASHITLDPGTTPRTLTDPGVGHIKKEQYDEDRKLTWHKDISASDVAYILYQAPVLIAVHAREMLSHE
ncbi:hypothetical protein [Rhizohabitans arisaemae]|uniref:hypothetical protein n=1 Tax=Rhizohabitans arisaemae TaxID=2720610 RepID=UPI0024B2133B|nr:hypothetical protein [Rhizohabitans arisaemae]